MALTLGCIVEGRVRRCEQLRRTLRFEALQSALASGSADASFPLEYLREAARMGQLLLEHFHGAVTRVGVSETAFPHRAEGYNMLVLSEWTDPDRTEACIAWARDSFEALRPYMGTRRYVNYFDADERMDAMAAAYGPNYGRLQQIKAKYDPENLFRLNQNILPTA